MNSQFNLSVNTNQVELWEKKLSPVILEKTSISPLSPATVTLTPDPNVRHRIYDFDWEIDKKNVPVTLISKRILQPHPILAPIWELIFFNHSESKEVSITVKGNLEEFKTNYYFNQGEIHMNNEVIKPEVYRHPIPLTCIHQTETSTQLNIGGIDLEIKELFVLYDSGPKAVCLTEKDVIAPYMWNLTFYNAHPTKDSVIRLEATFKKIP